MGKALSECGPNLLREHRDVAMGFCIYYRSSEPMHPALAFEINEHAHQLMSQYNWLRCEPLILRQQTDGFLGGVSKPNYVSNDEDFEAAELGGLPDGTVMTMVEVLCELSRSHDVDWEVAHDYEPNSIGHIHNGIAESELMEQMETLDSIGDLLEEFEEEVDGGEFALPRFGLRSQRVAERVRDDGGDDEPTLLKFPVQD